MRRRLALVAFASLALCGAAADGDLQRVMHLLGAQRHRQARFVERQYLAVLDRPLESRGELIYDAPDRLEQRTLQPRRENMIVAGEQLIVDHGGRRRVLDLRAYPQIAPFIDSVRDTLAGNCPALARSFAIDFRGDVRSWTLLLTPKAAAPARAVSQIRIDGAGGDLLRVEIRRPDGDHSSMRIENGGAP